VAERKGRMCKVATFASKNVILYVLKLILTCGAQRKKRRTEMTSVQDLINFGIPRGAFWSVDPKATASDQVLIYQGLTTGYNKRILKLFVDYFGKEKVENSIILYEKNMSPRFYSKIIKALNEIN
jgi:hypothetical protein